MDVKLSTGCCGEHREAVRTAPTMHDFSASELAMLLKAFTTAQLKAGPEALDLSDVFESAAEAASRKMQDISPQVSR